MGNLENYYFNINAIPVLVVGIFMLFLGFFVFTKKRNSNVNLSFLLICLSVAIWLFSTALGYFSKVPEIAKIWFKIDNFGVIFIPINVYCFTASFLKLNRKKTIITGYSLALILGVFILSTDFLVLSVKMHFWGFFPVWSTRSIFVLAFFFIFMLASIFELFYGYKYTIETVKRKQIVYFLSALVGAFTGSIDYLPALGVEIYPFGYLSIAFFMSLVTYAIVRHQLMDIEVFIKKTLVFAGLFIASYAVFASFAFLGSVVFENIVQNRWIAFVPSVFIIVLILRPLESFLRNVTDRYLFQKKYDYRKLLRTFSDEVLTVLDLDMLVNLTVNKLVEIMKLENASILLCDGEGTESRIIASAGDFTSEERLNGKENLVAFMQKRGGYVLRPDSDDKKSFSTEIVQDISKLRASLIIPLTHQNNMVGVLSLGKKKSDEEFTQDDIDILLPLAKTLSIAVTNAQLFEQLSEAQAQAAQREKMAVIGTLSAGINHEICNPLGIARGQCEMFLLNLAEGIYKDKSQDELLEKAKEIMEKVINETDRATVITRKLSSFAKPAKGKIEGNIKIEKELEEVISLVEHDLKLDNIQVVKELEKDLPPIEADRKQVQEIFFNIIRNAAQSIKGNGKITIRASNKNEKVTVGIEDTGEGISKNNLDKIFNPFYTTKEPGKGAGLGLFIVKQIIERNKGKIFVKSQPGEGTIFTVEFNTLSSA